MRILGGEAKGRPLEAPKGEQTRPTSALVRESVFAIYAAHMTDASFLELFCGSGAMAMEALSRGAKEAVLVDKSAKAIVAAKINAGNIGYENRCEIYRNDWRKAADILRKKGRLFDFVYVDPPYASDCYEAVLRAMDGLLTPGGIVVCEHGDREMPIIDGLVKGETRRYGNRRITAYGREEA